MSDIKDFVEKYESLLPVGGALSSVEYERRAGEFLVALATITHMKHLLTSDKIKLLSIQTAVYAEQMSKGGGKTMTQDKISAEASPDYIKAREDLESIDNDISYLRAYYEIYMSAHVFYRQLAKGENF